MPSGNVANSEGLWTSPYLDEWGLGLMVTYVVPAISQVYTSMTILM